MTAQTGLFVARDAGGNGTTAKGARQALAGLLAKNSDGTVRVGVLLDGQGPVVTGAAGMTYNVRKHVAVTKATEANGPVLVPNDGTVSVTTDPAPGSNSRIDVVYVLQPLVSGDGGSATSVAPAIDVVKGTASATPSVPAIPTGALELARVTVPSGATATSGLTITQGPVTWPGGGVVRSYVDADAATLYANGATVATFALPAIGVASRVVVDAIGSIGFVGETNKVHRLGFTASAGTLTDPNIQEVPTVAGGTWALFGKGAYLDIPANTAVTLTTAMLSTATGGAYWSGIVKAQRYLPGEY